jgi:hypothetical protein
MLWCACSDSSAKGLPTTPLDGDSGITGVHVKFDPGQGAAMSLGAIPWPDDLYLQDGHVTLSDLPGSPSDYTRSLRMSLSELDGFGVATPVYFFLDGAIDADSLPQTAEESVGPRASVFLIDADTGSPDAFQRVRAEMQWSADEARLALRPALGHPLTPGRRYAAIVTRRVKDTHGQPLVPAPKFAAVRDPSVSLNDARLAQVRAEFTPVLETLAKGDTAREDVVGMAVFRVQTANTDLQDARRMVRSNSPPSAANVVRVDASALDRVFGDVNDASMSGAAAHDQLAGIVHGTLPSPNFVSATVKVHGAWTRDETGALQIKRMDDVPFTMFIPKGGNGPSAVVLYQHQRDHERSDAVFVANELARRNIATFAIDAPFQGLRAKSDATRGVDTKNRFTGAPVADRFGDEPGVFFVTQDEQGKLRPFHPFYARDALRQGVVDLMTAVRYLDEGDLSQLSSSAQNQFDVRRLGFIGEDVGGQMGTMLAPFEPKLQALALFAPSAFVAQGFGLNADDQQLFGMLAGLLGRDANSIDYERDAPAFWPELSVFETLLGRGEPMAYASLLRRAPVNIWMLMAQGDEATSNLSTEAFAVALGASYLGGEARWVGDLGRQPAQSGDVISGNFAIENDHVTRLLRSYDPADHSLLLSTSGSHAFQDPVRPPFEALSSSETFDNPSASVREQLADYFDSFFTCVRAVSPTSSAIKCGAQVTAP